MKERPILFSGPMVRAILDGRKTQTRRVVKPQPYEDAKWGLVWEPKGKGPYNPWYCQRNVSWHPITDAFRDFWNERGGSPYGKPGDRLWVREAHWLQDVRPHGYVQSLIGYEANNALLICDPGEGDRPRALQEDEHGLRRLGNRMRPSIHMPRWASRLTLEVTGVRVERLQEISEADAIEEGLKPDHLWDRRNTPTGWWTGWAHRWESPCDAFREIWEAINGDESWDANPWVWVIEFRRV